MAATLERLEDSRVTLDVTVPSEVVERGLDAAFRRLVGRTNIPGFRRGKAPRAVFERFVGRPRLWQEALDPLVDEAYEAAVAEAGLEPVTAPEVEVAEIEDRQDLRFKATVTVKPDVELGDYKGIAVAPEPVEVGDADVDKALDQLRERRARWTPVEDEPAEVGMLVVIDVTGEVDGEPADAEKGVGAVLGEGQLRPALEEGIIGMRTGETRPIPLTFGEDDADAKLAGKSGTFQVTLAEGKRKVLPALDDDFAREVSEAGSLEELRDWLKNRLLEAARERAESEFAERCAAAATEQTQVEIPAVLIDRQAAVAMDDLAAQIAQNGLSLDAYLASQGKSPDDLKADLRPAAERRVKTRLVLEAIAKREGLEPTDEDLRQRIDRMAAQYGQNAAAFRKAMQRADRRAELRADARLEQAVSFLKERALANVHGDAAPGEA